MKQIALVIPTIRNLDFLNSWGDAFAVTDLYIIEDHPAKTVAPPHHHFRSIHHFDWSDIQKDFGSDEWIFSRRNAGIRSYGFWKAWKSGADIILTLDDDCYPVGDPRQFVPAHVNNLSLTAPHKWFATYPDPQWMFTRGFPYSIRHEHPVMVSHGIWSGALDLDGQTEVKLPTLLSEKPYPPIRQFIPFGYYYPMCSMNLAFNREVTPLMFFPMMGFKADGSSWDFDRFDDIWAGIFSKKIMDHLGWAVVNGFPYVEHRKISAPKANLFKEKNGLQSNEFLWQNIDQVKLTQTDPLSLFAELITKISFPAHPYFSQLTRAIQTWIKAFNPVEASLSAPVSQSVSSHQLHIQKKS